MSEEKPCTCSRDAKYCTAIDAVKCAYNQIDELEKQINSINSMIEDAKESDPEFYGELEQIFNGLGQGASKGESLV